MAAQGALSDGEGTGRVVRPWAVCARARLTAGRIKICHNLVNGSIGVPAAVAAVEAKRKSRWHVGRRPQVPRDTKEPSALA